ncbi:alkylated DNA repair protein alkB homolog 8 [Arabidopsis lyrata subsp. lyrata]|nr:alkylated DNA repair protein alkB homolog 8 [Arabidopsis lyrata subsp. lyrata]|eukprot:XP_020869568.1 alkylated DNA repair protein alkB homolog 8 [Arabidopsis lyrata subsp. lyrata]
MILDVLRTIRTFSRAQNLPSSGFYSISTSKMRDIKVKSDSKEFLTSSDEEEETVQIIESVSIRESSLSVKSTPEIEKKYVHRVYDAIAPHFSSTRFAKWPKVAAFLESLPPGSVILDAGCGNGKYLGLNPSCFFIGCDISHPLIKICSDKGQEVVVADAVNLPYREEFGDAAISIAVLHHLSTENRRKKAIEELVRVVKPGGYVLITVWAAEQEDTSLLTKWTPLSAKYVEEWVGPGSPMNSPRVRNNPFFSLESIPETEVSTKEQKAENSPFIGLESIPESEESTREQRGESIIPETKASVVEQKDENSVDESLEALKKSQQEYFVPWHLPYHRAEVSGASASALASGLAKKDDRKGAVVYNRYYHVFSEGELERLASGVGNAMIVDRFYDKSNWCIVLQKAALNQD